MEKELNLIDILKDYPQGTKLYSTIFGWVDFEYIENEEITVTNNISGDTETFNKNGSWYYGYTNECMLFPSKENRDWSKFKVEPEMVDGEIYYVKNNIVEWIYIYKRTYTFKTSHYVAVLNNYFNYYMELNGICTTQTDNIEVLRKATEEEKRMFFQIIEKNGRKWDADKKELVRIEKKFDVYTLQPFDKVLTRDWNDSVWRCNIYEYFKEGQCYPFITINGVCNQCVPYNDKTKHLVGTTEMPPKKYITWEE